MTVDLLAATLFRRDETAPGPRFAPARTAGSALVPSGRAGSGEASAGSRSVWAAMLGLVRRIPGASAGR